MYVKNIVFLYCRHLSETYSLSFPQTHVRNHLMSTRRIPKYTIWPSSRLTYVINHHIARPSSQNRQTHMSESIIWPLFYLDIMLETTIWPLLHVPICKKHSCSADTYIWDFTLGLKIVSYFKRLRKRGHSLKSPPTDWESKTRKTTNRQQVNHNVFNTHRLLTKYGMCWIVSWFTFLIKDTLCLRT